MDSYELVKADTVYGCRKGSTKVETPNGCFLITVGKELDGRVVDTVTVYPNIHPGEKKILIKKNKSQMMMVRCKTARRK